MGKASFGITTRLFMLHEQEHSQELMGKTQGIIRSTERLGGQMLKGTAEPGAGASEPEPSRAQPPTPEVQDRGGKGEGRLQRKQLTDKFLDPSKIRSGLVIPCPHNAK